MNSSLKIFYSATVLVAVLLIADQVGAFSILEFFGLEESEPEETANSGDGPAQNWAKPGLETDYSKIEFTDIEMIFANLSDQQRKAYLDNDEAFKGFVNQEAISRSILMAARSNKMDQNANVQFLMGRAADNILRETYINQLTREKLVSQLPSEEQLVEYYENNKDKFILPERIQLWQIFFQIQEGTAESDIEAITQKAAGVSADLSAGKIDFTSAAIQYSDHVQSRDNGGNMGMVNVSDLLPALKDTILNASENQVTQPLRSDSGIHIIKRGVLVPQQDVEYEQIKGQLAEAVNKQINAQFRQAVFEQATKSYPLSVDENRMEEWRIRLRTGLE